MKDYILFIREDVPEKYHMTGEEINEIICAFKGKCEDVPAHLLAEARKRDPNVPDLSEWVEVMQFMRPTACLDKRGVRLVPDGNSATDKTFTISVNPTASFFKRVRALFMVTFFPKSVERSIRNAFLRELYKEGAISKEQMRSMTV